MARSVRGPDVRAARMRRPDGAALPACAAASPATASARPSHVLAETVPLAARSAVPSGTQVHDWTINDEWNVREAWIADATGRRVVDVRDHTLHLVCYSSPVRGTFTLDGAPAAPAHAARPSRLDPLPHQLLPPELGLLPDPAPARRAGGRGPFDVVVDTTLEPGELTYGELFLPGDTDEEVSSPRTCATPRWSTTTCPGSPSPSSWPRRSRPGRRAATAYRFLFAPGTIGSLTWLSRNPDVLPRIRHGLVLTGLGGGGPLVYKRTRHADRPSTPPRATSYAGAGVRCATTRRTATTSGSSTRSG